MKLKRDELTPQMRDYDALNDPGQRRYVPYLMYFHRANFSSQTVNTDRCGFRISTGPDGARASAAGHMPAGPVRIISGGSSVLGIGSTSDSNTLASRLWSQYAPAAPWLNFGSYCYNPTQEVLLFTLYRHLLGEVDEVVVLSGLNALTVARLPEWQQGDNGAFYFCGEYFEKMEELRDYNRKNSKIFGRREERRPDAAATTTIATFDDVRRDTGAVIDSAAEITLRQLDIWRRVAGPETRVSYVLQPMATWMGHLAPQEKLLFDEIDRVSKLGTWDELYGDISTPEAAGAFATALRTGCEKLGVRFLDLNPIAAAETTQQDWLFVDRAHYTDTGADAIARMTAEHLGLS